MEKKPLESTGPWGWMFVSFWKCTIIGVRAQSLWFECVNKGDAGYLVVEAQKTLVSPSWGHSLDCLFLQLDFG